MSEESENKTELNKFIEYEKAFAELFKELRLKPAQCELIRAFLTVSKGQTVFEASFLDLARVNNKIDGDDYQQTCKRLNDSTRYAFSVLQNWQQENKLTLVKVVTKGRRDIDTEGIFIYKKSKYQFVLLEELNKAIAENPDDVEAVITKMVAELKKTFVPVEKAKVFHPRGLMKRAKKTIYTKLTRVFRLAVSAGDNPIQYCQRILNDGWDILKELEAEYTDYQNREAYIANFENELNEEYEEEIKEELEQENNL